MLAIRNADKEPRRDELDVGMVPKTETGRKPAYFLEVGDSSRSTS